MMLDKSNNEYTVVFEEVQSKERSTNTKEVVKDDNILTIIYILKLYFTVS